MPGTLDSYREVSCHNNYDAFIIEYTTQGNLLLAIVARVLQVEIICCNLWITVLVLWAHVIRFPSLFSNIYACR